MVLSFMQPADLNKHPLAFCWPFTLSSVVPLRSILLEWMDISCWGCSSRRPPWTIRSIKD